MYSFHQQTKTSQIQKLQMSYLMKRAFLMLQMTNLELKKFLEIEIEKNPILEIKPNNDEISSLSDKKKKISSIKYKPSLFEHLFTQAKEAFFLKKDLYIAENIIGNLDKKGYFSLNLENFAKDLKISKEDLFKVLKIIKTFDPKGIATKNLKERILLQIDNKKSLEHKIIDDHFDNILKNKISFIAKKIKKNEKCTQNIIEKIILKSCFDPTEKFSKEFIPKEIFSDIKINKIGKNWIIEIDDDLPYFEINKNLVKVLENDKKDSSKKYLFLAKILMKNIKIRRKTLYNISVQIIKKQRSYLLSKSQLVPISIKEVAKNLELHPSTISRAILNKYIECPRGLLPIKSFFIPSLKNKKKSLDLTKAKLLLMDLIANENKQKPLSDDKISKIIKEKGFEIPRRTISKYRKILKIGSSNQRKRFQ